MHAILKPRRLWFGLALATAFILTGLSATAAGDDAEKTLDLIKNKGLKGFVTEVRSKAAQATPQAILSNKACDRITDPDERQRAQQRRALGLAMLKETVALKTVPPGSELSAVDEATTIRSWSLAQQSYGNLILASVAEDTAVTLLLRLLADPKSDVGQVRAHAETLFEHGPSSDYWLQMLDQEKDPLKIATTNTARTADYLRLADMFEALQKQKAAGQKNAVYPGSGGDYGTCFATYDPAQVGWLYNTLCIRKSALEACLSVKEKMGHIPENRDEFRAALKQKASAVMKREDRLGGRIDSGQVWIIWRDALGK